ncbi:sulfatase-like hydrolase/transferase [Pontiella sulfatireligans]|uniref:Choline-sulfatase n=1 Tax=Pontiella sulfatireligans TaxID=2750658 RepID=A0A6C2UT75_9BACT|nr:sulfatase-like hydrolase/transferase [Pontiella sulfatireligans]SPS74515.1 sulfatase S1_72 [Kiritimatiellales bacterium]VGO22461.1 Choline-sulfatase [Pontiella sulfatireligans]
MSTRQLNYIAGCVAALCVANAVADKPNILWIVTDDQRPDSLACFNEAVSGTKLSPLGYVMSPNVDQLAKQGTLFTQAYCNAPACAPSRASMHYGQYPFRSGVYGFEQTHQAAESCKQTVPQVMRSAGYKTAEFGKHGYYIFDWGPGLTWNTVDQYDHSVDAKNDLRKKGLTDYFPDSKKVNGKKIGKQEVFHYPDGTVKEFCIDAVKGQEIPPEDIALRKEVDAELDIIRAYTREQSTMIIGGQSPQPPEKTIDGQIASAMINYLEDEADADQPQFIHLGFHFPHSPVLAPKKYRDLFMAKEKEIPYTIPDFSPAEVEKMPPQLQLLYKKMNFSGLTKAEKLQAIRDYYAFCAHGDAQVGRAIGAFLNYCKKSSNDWIIVYVCGDHSWHLGEQGIEAKFAPWDHSTHNAMIAASSIKGLFPKGAHNDNLVEFVDCAPTFYEAAGIKTDAPDYAYLDGSSLRKSAKGQAKREYIVGEINHVVGPRAYMRSKDFAFSMKTREKNGKPGDKWGHLPGEGIKWALECPRAQAELCLYDLRSDPGEHWNVANDPKYAPLADWFRQKLGNIVLGDRRAEVNWRKENDYVVTDFALGADDKKLDIPASLIPEPTR